MPALRAASGPDLGLATALAASCRAGCAASAIGFLRYTALMYRRITGRGAASVWARTRLAVHQRDMDDAALCELGAHTLA